jgi:hypothetical protein
MLNIPTLYTIPDFSRKKNDKFPDDLTVAFCIVRSKHLLSPFFVSEFYQLITKAVILQLKTNLVQ